MIRVIGVGPGSADYLTPAARKAAEGCELLVGGRRALELFDGHPAPKFVVAGDLSGVRQVLEANRSKTVGVLVSGDPGMYSLLDFILRHFPDEPINVVPGVSSVQLAFARCRLPWHGASVVNLHGRELSELLPSLRGTGPVAVLTDGRTGPAAIAEYLLSHGLSGFKMTVCADLSFPGEKVLELNLEEATRTTPGYEKCVVLLTGEYPPEDRWPYVTPGIPDDAFLRGDVAMTAAEVRCITLSRARLQVDSVVFDVGAGTGTISVEAALLARKGTVFAIDRDPGAIRLIRANKERFRLPNLQPVQARAPEGLEGLPPPDRAFIGGSGGKLREILVALGRLLLPGGRVVVNAVTLETLASSVEILEELGFTGIEVCCLNVSRLEPMAGRLAYRGFNPVHVVSAQKPWRD